MTIFILFSWTDLYCLLLNKSKTQKVALIEYKIISIFSKIIQKLHNDQFEQYIQNIVHDCLYDGSQCETLSNGL